MSLKLKLASSTGRSLLKSKSSELQGKTIDGGALLKMEMVVGGVKQLIATAEGLQGATATQQNVQRPNRSVLRSLLSSSAPAVRREERHEGHAAELLLVCPVGARQRRGGGSEQGEPLRLVQHRQPREHHHVPRQGGTQARGRVHGIDQVTWDERSNLVLLTNNCRLVPRLTRLVLPGRHRGPAESRGEDHRGRDGGRQRGALRAG